MSGRVRLVGLQTGAWYDLDLSRAIARGGEATIHSVEGRAGRVAKVYHPSRISRERANKLLRMTTRPSVVEAAAWPQDVLGRGRHGPVVGYVMPRVADAESLHRFQHPILRRRHPEISRYPYDWLYRVAFNLAELVAQIHRAGHVVGDLSSANVLVNWRTGIPTLIDVDSIQYRDPITGTVHRCTVARPEYLAPELHGVDLRGVDRSSHHDAFALAVLIYQLLVEGDHPYRSTSVAGAPDPGNLAGRIREGLFAHAPPRAVPASLTLPFSVIPDPVQALFVRAFHDGHRKPDERPTADEWRAVLRGVLRPGAFVTCPVNDRHRFPGGAGPCPWCQRRQLLGYDPYPADEKAKGRARAGRYGATREGGIGGVTGSTGRTPRPWGAPSGAKGYQFRPALRAARPTTIAYRRNTRTSTTGSAKPTPANGTATRPQAGRALAWTEALLAATAALLLVVVGSAVLTGVLQFALPEPGASFTESWVNLLATHWKIAVLVPVASGLIEYSRSKRTG